MITVTRSCTAIVDDRKKVSSVTIRDLEMHASWLELVRGKWKGKLEEESQVDSFSSCFSLLLIWLLIRIFSMCSVSPELQVQVQKFTQHLNCTEHLH